MHLQYADQAVGLAARDDRGHVLGGVPGPAVAVGEDHPDAVRAECLDVGEGLGLAGVPGVRVVHAAHHEVVAVGLQEAAVADVQAGGLGGDGGGRGLGGGHSEDQQAEEGGQGG